MTKREKDDHSAKLQVGGSGGNICSTLGYSNQDQKWLATLPEINLYLVCFQQLATLPYSQNSFQAAGSIKCTGYILSFRSTKFEKFIKVL